MLRPNTKFLTLPHIALYLLALTRFLAPWRSNRNSSTSHVSTQSAPPATPLPRDPTIGRPLSPANGGCPLQQTQPTALRSRAGKRRCAKDEFARVCSYAPPRHAVRGILRSRNVDNLKKWLKDANKPVVYAIQRFAQMLQSDLDAVTCGLTLHWSNGQTEGEITRLKMPKCSMHGGAGVKWLRVPVLPL